MYTAVYTQLPNNMSFGEILDLPAVVLSSHEYAAMLCLYRII